MKVFIDVPDVGITLPSIIITEVQWLEFIRAALACLAKKKMAKNYVDFFTYINEWDKQKTSHNFCSDEAVRYVTRCKLIMVVRYTYAKLMHLPRVTQTFLVYQDYEEAYGVPMGKGRSVSDL